MYKLKELDWKGWDNDWAATTSFGTYFIKRRSYPDPLRPTKRLSKFTWGYCFTEFFDENEFSCAGEEEGKRLAWENWKGRILPCLEEVV